MAVQLWACNNICVVLLVLLVLVVLVVLVAAVATAVVAVLDKVVNKVALTGKRVSG